MTSALKEELKKWLNQLAADERKDPARYHDSGMLFRLPNGLAVEPVLIRKKFLKWQDAHPEFPRIVFHGLRHPYVKRKTKNLQIRLGQDRSVFRSIRSYPSAPHDGISCVVSFSKKSRTA